MQKGLGEEKNDSLSSALNLNQTDTKFVKNILKNIKIMRHGHKFHIYYKICGK